MKYLFTPLLLFLLSCASVTSDAVESILVDFDDKEVYYEGRVQQNEKIGATEIYWPGSSVSLKFEGTLISAVLEDEKGENYFTVVVDGKQTSVLDLKKGKNEYLLANNLPLGVHQVEIHKRNDWGFGKTLFHSYKVLGKKTLEIDAKKMFIELYGDSISVGYGNEDSTGQDRSTGDVTNNYLAYGAVTARNLNAEYSCIAHSGIGIMVSWHDLIMPEEYYRWNPFDAASKWDFSSKRQPDVVVVNLFQNDSWLVKRKKHPEYVKRFGDKAPDHDFIIESYVSFLKSIRKEYKDAKIICMLGNMDVTEKESEWPGYVWEAVSKMRDRKIYKLFVPYKGTKGHPRVNEQAIIADKLTTFIKTH